MIVYVDVLFVVNFVMDLFLLLSVNKVLKRNVSFKRIIISALEGELSLLLLFIPIGNIWLLFIRVLIAFIMCITSFKYKSISYSMENVVYFYMIATIMGGVGYLVYLSYENKLLYLVFLVLIIPLVLYIVMKLYSRRIVYQQMYYGFIEFYEGNKVFLSMYMDTGNSLVDPYTNKPIILVKECLVPIYDYKYLYVPFNSLNSNGLLKCIKVRNIVVNNKIIKNCYVGISDNKLMGVNVDCILNIKCLEDI